MKLLIFDGFSILNRGFYAIPVMTNSDGEFTNAVYGFLSIFFRFMDEEKPDYVCVAFDYPAPTFRHNIFGAYKGTRKSMPEELRGQIPIVKNLLSLMKIYTPECEGYEADDIIGSLAKTAAEKDIKTVIISGDRDLLQLATDEVKIRIPKTRAGKSEVEDYLAKDVLEKYGVSPQRFIDLKALMGDASDNIPGVPGIGEKTAEKIMTAYGSLENAYENAKDIKPKKASENLVQYWEQALLSRELATIVTDAPVELTLTDALGLINPEAFDEVKRLELRTFYKRFESKESPKKKQIEYEYVDNGEKAAEIFESLDNAAFMPVWDKNEIIGLAISNDKTNWYMDLTMDEILWNIVPWFESDYEKITFGVKAELKKWETFGIKPNGKILDVQLAAYVLDSSKSYNDPADLANSFLNEIIKTPEDVLGNKGKRESAHKSFKDIPVNIVAEYAAETSSALYRMGITLFEKLTNNEQMDLYAKIELPIASLLNEIEFIGVKTDPVFLNEYGKTLAGKIDGLTSVIYDLAGSEFNINSPSQLGTVLFENLGLQGGKKGKKGYSTSVDELDKLKDKHEIISHIMEYRSLTKLKGTYVDGFIPLINPFTDRIHTTFIQTLTATGRLSSQNPNLQNIPVRTTLGRELRKAFIADEGMVFLDADYNQIELRLLAHLSQDDALIQGFVNQLDIHALTASQVFSKDINEVTPEERRSAKAVNFGIVYGISPYGLSEDLGISVKEADDYINAFYEKYPDVKKYLDETIKNAKKDGYVTTMFKRRRSIPELKSSNYNTRSFGERVAMNMPLQGSAADIIKIAMLRVSEKLRVENLTAKIILQVHDELLVESPEEEADRISLILKNEMENAAKLSVPLLVDVKKGSRWYDAK